jgi:hypothetical protein
MTLQQVALTWKVFFVFLGVADVAVLSVGQWKPLKLLKPLGVFRNQRILAVQKRNSAWFANLRFCDWLEDVGIVEVHSGW